MRFLQSTQRTVSQNQDQYRAAWTALRDQATALEVRAWMFCARDDAARFIEFLEWKGADNAELGTVLQQHLQNLERFGNGMTQQWVEP